MATQRDEAFEEWFESLPDKGGIDGRDIMRKAWEAGRRYEVERQDKITRRLLLGPDR